MKAGHLQRGTVSVFCEKVKNNAVCIALSQHLHPLYKAQKKGSQVFLSFSDRDFIYKTGRNEKKHWYKKNCIFEGTCEQKYRNNSLMVQFLLRSLAQNQSWSILLPCVYHILYTF